MRVALCFLSCVFLSSFLFSVFVVLQSVSFGSCVSSFFSPHLCSLHFCMFMFLLSHGKHARRRVPPRHLPRENGTCLDIAALIHNIITALPIAPFKHVTHMPCGDSAAWQSWQWCTTEASHRRVHFSSDVGHIRSAGS